jgi:hypothetical protein
VTRYTFDNDIRKAKAQFHKYVDEIERAVKTARRQGKPMSLTRLNRMIYVLCESWVRHVMDTYGPSVQPGEHMPYDYWPPRRELNRLSDILVHSRG